MCAAAAHSGEAALWGQATLQILHRFAAGPSSPTAAPIESKPGVFIGAAGLLYRATSQGDFSVLSTEPFIGELFPASNGYLYGVTGSGNQGTGIYIADYAGNTKLINGSFQSVFPGFFQTDDGGLYGLGSTDESGTEAEAFFRMSLKGEVTWSQTSGIPRFPVGGPIQNSDGNLYGTIVGNPATGSAVVYRATPPQGPVSVISTLPGFSDPSGGDYPSGPLLEVANVVYGVNTYGGKGSGASAETGYGTVFAVNPKGAYQVIWKFAGGSAGQNPTGGLILASDGYLYGTTAYSEGAQIFRLKINGSECAIVYQFASGLTPTSLLQGTDGKFYGVLTSAQNSTDAFFSLDLGLPGPTPAVGYFEPSTAAIGDKILIRGDYLQGVTGVNFTGAPATQFGAIGPYFVVAVVPSGAATGPVTITTPNGSVTRKQILTIP